MKCIKCRSDGEYNIREGMHEIVCSSDTCNNRTPLCNTDAGAWHTWNIMNGALESINGDRPISDKLTCLCGGDVDLQESVTRSYACYTCENCTRRTSQYKGEGRKAKAAAEWKWIQAFTPKVSAQCMTEITASLPDDKAATGFVTYCTVHNHPGYQTSDGHLIVKPIEPPELKGKEWAAVQVDQTVFEINGVRWMFALPIPNMGYSLAIQSSRRSGSVLPLLVEGGDWKYWNESLDEACDDHIVLKGGE